MSATQLKSEGVHCTPWHDQERQDVGCLLWSPRINKLAMQAHDFECCEAYSTK